MSDISLYQYDKNESPKKQGTSSSDGPKDSDSQGDDSSSENAKGKSDNAKGGSGSGGPGGKGPQNFLSRNSMVWMIVALGVIMLLFMMNGNAQRADEVTWQDFLKFVEQGAFEDEIVVKEYEAVGVLKKGTAGRKETPTPETPDRVSTKITPDLREYFVTRMQALNPQVVFVPENNTSILLPFLLNWGPLIVILFLIYFFVFRSIRSGGGGPGMLGQFGRSKHKLLNKEHSNVTLADVAGIDEAKDEVGEIIEFLKHPKKFQRLGGRVPRGVLLIGSPGCGKTLLAKAVAGEAEVPFFSISGSDFVEMFVGVGASRVRDLFKSAKDSSPCIIFLDEIDAVGRKRGSGFNSGGHDEREQTLNAILVEMDGFDSSDQVIVIAATNRGDVLDPALVRPGRFDRQIDVPLPDVKGRMEILKVHSRRVKMSPDVDLEKVARGTPMFSGAELAAIINEAAIGATLLEKDYVELEDLEEARDKVRWGRARKSQVIDDEEKKVIAYHEAGHAIVMNFDEDSEPLHKVTIIPRGQALGVTFMLPEKDKHIHTKKQLMARLRVCYGGRIAEQMFCDDIASGAAGDIQQASRIARAMITEYGMSDDLGFLLYGTDESSNPWEQPDKKYSEETAKKIDAEVKKLIDRTYNETQQLLAQHRDQVEALAQALLKYETLNKSEVDRLMRGEELSKPTVGDLLKAEQEKTKSETAPPSSSDSSSKDGESGESLDGPMPSPA